MSTITTLAADSLTSASAKFVATVVTPTPPFDGATNSNFPGSFTGLGRRAEVRVIASLSASGCRGSTRNSRAPACMERRIRVASFWLE
jgi:hypothetical protein